MQTNFINEADRRKGLRRSLQGLPMETIDKMVDDAITCLRTQIFTDVLPKSKKEAIEVVSYKMEDRFDYYEAQLFIKHVLSEDKDAVFKMVKEMIESAIECHVDDIFWSEK